MNSPITLYTPYYNPTHQFMNLSKKSCAPPVYKTPYNYLLGGGHFAVLQNKKRQIG